MYTLKSSHGHIFCASRNSRINKTFLFFEKKVYLDAREIILDSVFTLRSPIMCVWLNWLMVTLV